MIVWATDFPVRGGVTAEQVLAAAKVWLTGSPLLPWTGFQFSDEPMNEITRYDHADQVVSIVHACTDTDEWTGLQHVWVERREREWTTEIVSWCAPQGLRVSIRLDCNLLAPGMELPRPNKPYFVRQCLERLRGGTDAWLTVSDTPTHLQENQVEDAAAIIRGTTAIQLPVVYVSAGAIHRPYVDVGEISRWLSGMAHVVVEPSRHFSFALARHVERKNPYGGAVSVFWPKAIRPQARFLPGDFASPIDMARAVAERVRIGLTAVRPTSQLTWAFLREHVSRYRLDALRQANASDGVNEYITAFDAELQAKNDQLEEAEHEIRRLHAEMRQMEAARDPEGGLVARGNESEYYSGEQRDTLLFAVELALKQVGAEGRRRDILEAILVANPRSGNDERIESDIKRLFNSGGELAAPARRALEDLGFDISEEGKHFKAIYHGDGRYTFTISKTSSDHRAGKNLAAQMIRTLFR